MVAHSHFAIQGTRLDQMKREIGCLKQQLSVRCDEVHAVRQERRSLSDQLETVVKEKESLEIMHAQHTQTLQEQAQASLAVMCITAA